MSRIWSRCGEVSACSSESGLQKKPMGSWFRRRGADPKARRNSMKVKTNSALVASKKQRPIGWSGADQGFWQIEAGLPMGEFAQVGVDDVENESFRTVRAG